MGEGAFQCGVVWLMCVSVRTWVCVYTLTFSDNNDSCCVHEWMAARCACLASVLASVLAKFYVVLANTLVSDCTVALSPDLISFSSSTIENYVFNGTR